MIARSDMDKHMLAALVRVRGVEEARPLRDAHRPSLLEIEEKAEEQSLMGLGKVINTGVQEILRRDYIYVALTDMDFDWECYTTLVLKKGSEIVGEDVHEPAKIERLSKDKNVWFLHRNFVVYKNKITFPQDIMKKICHFEIPCLPADFCRQGMGLFASQSIGFANPCVPGDMFLKQHYFDGLDEQGLGTILVGATR